MPSRNFKDDEQALLRLAAGEFARCKKEKKTKSSSPFFFNFIAWIGSSSRHPVAWAVKRAELKDHDSMTLKNQRQRQFSGRIL
jgi:hypothetical protein